MKEWSEWGWMWNVTAIPKLKRNKTFYAANDVYFFVLFFFASCCLFCERYLCVYRHLKDECDATNQDNGILKQNQNQTRALNKFRSLRLSTRALTSFDLHWRSFILLWTFRRPKPIRFLCTSFGWPQLLSGTQNKSARILYQILLLNSMWHVQHKKEQRAWHKV